MTIDEAIALVGHAHIRDLMRNGRAFGVAADSFNGHAITAQLRNDFRRATAYYVLAATSESLLWQAIRPEDELREAFMEGSARAMNELRRRGYEFAGNAKCWPAWL